MQIEMQNQGANSGINNEEQNMTSTEFETSDEEEADKISAKKRLYKIIFGVLFLVLVIAVGILSWKLYDTSKDVEKTKDEMAAVQNKYEKLFWKEIDVSQVPLTTFEVGDQKGCDGCVDEKTALESLKILQESSFPEQEIYFENFENKIQVKDGICSSLSFEFALHALKQKKRARENGITKNIDWLKNFAVHCGQSGNDAFLRSKQAAMNQICVKNTNLDTSWAKVHALGKLYDINVEQRIGSKIYPLISHEKSFHRRYKQAIKLEEVLERMEMNSVNFARGIETNDSVKKELHGHSLVVIKSKNGKSGVSFYLYDPNFGIEIISALHEEADNFYAEVSTKLFKVFKERCEQFTLDELSFYSLKYNGASNNIRMKR